MVTRPSSPEGADPLSHHQHLTAALIASAALAASVTPGCGGDEAADTGGESDGAAENATGDRGEQPRAARRPPRVDTRVLEERLRLRFEEIQDDEWRASCPEEVKVRKGGRFRCRVRAPTVVWTMTVTQLDSVGKKVRLRGKPRFAKSIEHPPTGVTIKATEDLGERP